MGLPLALFFLSGFAGLTYEVLWQRELGLLFGNSTQATATTLAVFFLGLALGSWLFGRRAARCKRPLVVFGILELLIGATALLLPLLLPLYRSLFAPLYGLLGDRPALFLLAKFVLSCLVLAPPAVLMGGTLPVLAEAAVRRGGGLARSGIVLYAVNTAGAMVGAALAGFLLPQLLGYRGAYLVACTTSVLVGLVAWTRAGAEGAARAPSAPEPAGPASSSALLALAALSGFCALGLEVLWTRMAALAFINSVYSFAAVLVLFLAALAAAAGFARWLAARATRPATVLQRLLLGSALTVLFSGTLFRAVTGSPPSVGRGEDFASYLLAVAGVLCVAVVPAALVLGTVFPFLLRAEEARGSGSAGARIGRLIAWNTLGALFGSLAAGFLLPAWFGLWPSISALAGLYALGALLVPGVDRRGRLVGFVATGVVLLVAGVHGARDGDAGDRWDLRKDEHVIKRYEGSGGSVRVVRRRGALKLRFNNSYTLGGTAEPRWEHFQAHIPMCLHGDPKRVFFLGMGTGITAGAALRHDVDLVRVAEIVPEAVRASREHFGPWLGGLFADPRTDMVVEDARTLLYGLDDEYDVVVGDLFLPWRRGTSLLYTVEQFHAVKRRLAPGGVFAQWLPLYQLSEEAYQGIVASFVEVFGKATLWRGDFFSRRPIVALIGRADDAPWDANATLAAWARLEAKGAVNFDGALTTLPFMLYAGAIRSAAPAARRITDDDPWLEFAAPLWQRARAAGTSSAFTGRTLAAYQRSLLRELPPEEDPFLSRLSAVQQRYVLGGMHFYDYAVFTKRAERARRKEASWGYFRAVPEEVQPKRDLWID